MQFDALFTGVLALASVVTGAPVVDLDPEAAAAQRITALQTTYFNNIFGDVTGRYNGCFAQNIRTRKEWYVALFSHYSASPPSADSQFIRS
jgi:hypothetical protein